MRLNRRSILWGVLCTLILIGCIKDETIKITINTNPKELNDGWQTSTLNNEGIDSLLLMEALAYFFSEQYLINSKGLLIAKNGKIILESYCKSQQDAQRLHNIKSVTKSLMTVMTGIAIKEGYLDSNLNKTVYSYTPEYFDDNLDKQAITIAHCLRMTTGLEDPFYSVASVLPDNSIRTSLGVELIYQPGLVHYYNNGSANIVGGIISKVVNESFEKYTQDKLFSLLEIENYHWIKHNDGRVNPAFDLYLLPRDILKFGQFCLQNGYWQQQQILPTYWQQKSTQHYEDGFDGAFGYHWWLLPQNRGYYANGHGGQRIFILPQDDLVIVHIAEPSTDDTNLEEITTLLNLILAAV